MTLVGTALFFLSGQLARADTFDIATGDVGTIPLTSVANAQKIVVTLFGVSDGTNTNKQRQVGTLLP